MRAGQGSGSGRIPSLDGLRAVSIALVLAWHVSTRSTLPVIDQLWRVDAGNLGVRVFFVISGYLITSLLLAETERHGRIDLARFYLRRTMRIMPAFFFYLAVIAIFAWNTPYGMGLTGSHVTHAALYLANYLPTSWLVSHSWSLSVEEQFYLLWPGALLLLGLRGGFRMALLMMLIAPACRTIAAVTGTWPDNQRYAFECVADALAAGCLLARYRRTLAAIPLIRRVTHSPAMMGWPILALLIAMLSVRFKLAGALVGVTALNLTIAAGLDWCLRNPGKGWAALLNTRPVVFVGTLSYSLYLWQQPFLGPTEHLSLVKSLLLIFACALASFYLVERTGLRLRAILEDRLLGRA